MPVTSKFVNILILLIVVALVAFAMGAWTWLVVSSRSPKIYEIQPVFLEICSDLASLFRNCKRLYSLTGEVAQGLLQGSEELEGEGQKLFEASIIREDKKINKEVQSRTEDKENSDIQDKELDSGYRTKNWLKFFDWNKDNSSFIKEEERVSGELAVDDLGEVKEEELKEETIEDFKNDIRYY